MPFSLKLQQAVNHLRTGGVIAYPTEAVWGLGCDPFNEQAVRRLLSVKKRSADKGLILVAATIEQFTPYLEGLSELYLAALKAQWPGPTTFLVPDNGFAPALIKGEHHQIALRVSAHKQVAALCDLYGGPIVSTSANEAGKPAAKWSWQIQQRLAAKLDYILPGALGDSARPSEIRELVSGRILRAS